ncbi:uncharacterized [Tachysurus ichikawai]
MSTSSPRPSLPCNKLVTSRGGVVSEYHSRQLAAGGSMGTVGASVTHMTGDETEAEKHSLAPSLSPHISQAVTNRLSSQLRCKKLQGGAIVFDCSRR